MTGMPRHRQQRHKLAPDIEAYVVSRRAREKTYLLSLLSTSKATLDELLSLGAKEATRDRIERYAAGLMRSQGLIPSSRPPAAPLVRKATGEPSTKIGVDRSDTRSPNSLLEWKSLRIGQTWAIVERDPGGAGDREVLVRVVAIVRDGMHGIVVHGVTPRGRRRVVSGKRLLEGRAARLLEDAPAKEARSA